MKRTCLAVAAALSAWSGSAGADEPMTQLATFSGSVDFFATGAPLAIDGSDPGATQVDILLQSASVEVTGNDVPANAKLVAAYLYWGGSIPNDDCVGAHIDNQVGFHPPGVAMPTTVTADVCFCSDASAGSYDIQLCRKEVSALIPVTVGTYAVSDFAALIMNSSTNNASFSLVFVYVDISLPPRRVALWDGLQTMSSAVNPTQLITLDGLDIDDPPVGDLTWYVLEGDVGGSEGEQVRVEGVPSGLSLVLSDALNPADNPMNHTINTTVPPQADTIGVDIDQFDLTGALAETDTAVNITYSAGEEKWWIAYNIVGVNVFEPAFAAGSEKTWVLLHDADGNGAPSAGDTIRYTIHLANTGTAPGVVSVMDLIPAEAASWTLVDAAGGTDLSTTDTVIIDDVPVAAGAAADVVIDVVLADVPDQTPMYNEAAFDATPEGDVGTAYALAVSIRHDEDGDTIFDADDNCPLVANVTQADTDLDGVGDACDAEGSGGMGGAGGMEGTGGEAPMGGASPAAGGAAGAAGALNDDDDDTEASDASCNCRAAGRGETRWVWAAGLALAVQLLRRRAA